MPRLKTLCNLLTNLDLHIRGRCPVCGHFSFFLCVDTVQTARNHMCCLFCHSSSRKRHVAKVITALYGVDSLKDMENTGIKIYNTSSLDVFSRIFGNHEEYYASEYMTDVAAGTELKKRVYCQDLQHLSFGNEQFDVVISEDVLEHVRDDRQAFTEIHRVLKPGGYHVFTVPCSFSGNTVIRVDTSGGEDVVLLEPEFHGDPIRGQILTYRSYGVDLLAMVDQVGFETKVLLSTYADLKNGIVDSYIFLSKKSCGATGHNDSD